MKTYLSIGTGRLLDIIVYLDNAVVYEGMVEDAPDDIKTLKYSEIKVKNGQVIYKIFSDSQ